MAALHSLEMERGKADYQALLREHADLDLRRLRRLPRCNFPARTAFEFPEDFMEIEMPDTSQVKEHMDVISSDRKTVGKVDHLDGADKIKLTKQSSPDGQHHHFIPVSWIDHIDQHVHLNKTGADVTAHWQHGRT